MKYKLRVRPVVLWIVGEPGVGKTTLARNLLTHLSHPFKTTAKPDPKWTYTDTACAIGHYGAGPFDGSDTISYTGVPAAIHYWRSNFMKKQLTILDGDRTSTRNTVLEFVSATKHDIAVIHLVCDPLMAEARRADRSPDKVQNPSWVKGRKTKAARFAATFPETHRLEIDVTGFGMIGQMNTKSVALRLIRKIQGAK